MLQQKHLLGLAGYPGEDIQTIIDTAFTFREVLDRPIKKVPSLQGKTIVNLFFENSTRTRISFELAQKRLSADTVNFSASTSSLKKGETFKDTAQNIEAMKIDAVVMRHPTPGAPLHLTDHIDSIVINAGDGTHEHPTQAILDMTSLHEKFGYLKGLKVGIIGDIAHSRVALSNIHGLKTMGAEVTLCGPSTLIPPFAEELGVSVNYNVDEVIEAETEVDMPEEEVGSLQAEDEQTGVIVEAEDPDTVESPSPEAEDIQTDDQVDEVIDTEAEVDKLDEEAESLPAEDGQAGVTVEEEDLGISEALSHGAEATDDTIMDDHADEAIEATAEETVVEDYSKIKIFVDRIKKILSGLSSIGSKSDDSSEEGVENHAEAESHTGEAEDIQTDVQGEADEAVVGSRADEIQTASYSDSKRSRTKKTGIIISVLIMAAAVILLIVASIERRSAKSDLVQISKVAESIKQMQGEALKERMQIAHSQIESKELVVDALSLTRNGLELERANSDEIEVKRIIGVFINDIDERITKIKGNIMLLRNKLKETD